MGILELSTESASQPSIKVRTKTHHWSEDENLQFGQKNPRMWGQICFGKKKVLCKSNSFHHQTTFVVFQVPDCGFKVFLRQFSHQGHLFIRVQSMCYNSNLFITIFHLNGGLTFASHHNSFALTSQLFALTTQHKKQCKSVTGLWVNMQIIVTWHLSHVSIGTNV
jgi:hypothetical protein